MGNSTSFLTGREKTGGRQKGVANKVTSETRERIEGEADPIGFLINAVNGEPIEVADPSDSKRTITVHPSYEQRQDAAKILAKKILPDMKAVEHSGNVGPRFIEEMSTEQLLAILQEDPGRDGTPTKARSPSVVVAE